MATGTISSLGVGSGLELQSMLEQLKEVDQRPIETKKEKVTALGQKIEEFDSIKSTLLSMRTKGLALSLGSNFLETKTSVSGTSIEASSVSGAKDMSHSINVTSIASFSSWNSQGLATKTASMTTTGTTFSYKLGESGSTISLDVSAGTSLESLVTQINDDESNPGVTASIADTGFGANPYKLVLRSDESGEESRIFIQSQMTNPPPVSDRTVTISATEPIDISAANTNNEIVFQEKLENGTLGAQTTATIADGSYTSGDDLATAMETAMEAVSENGIDYSVTFDSDTKKFTIQENGALLHELKISWDTSNGASDLGFNAEADTWEPHSGLKLTESSGAGYSAPESDNTVDINVAAPKDISAASTNNEIIFRERLADGSLGAEKTAIIADGSYTTGADLATAMETAMEAASENGIDYAVTFDTNTEKFTIQENGSDLHELQINWDTSSAAKDLGFDAEADTYKPYDSSLNARFSVDNIAYQRQSNDDITDVIQGVNIDLKDTGTSTIGVESDFETVETTIKELVDSLNTLRLDLNSKSGYDIDSGEKGILFGESSVTRIDDELKNFMEQTLNLSGNITNMYDMGLTIDSDGNISMDSSQLSAALSANADDVIKFFTGDSDNEVTGFGDLMYDKLREYTGADGLLTAETDAAKTRITKLEEQIEKDTDLLNRRYDTMTMQFVKLDSYMRQMQSEASFLDQFFDTTKKSDK